MRIQRGLHRVAILFIGVLSLFFLISETCLSWSKYQRGLEQINLTSEWTQYRRDLKETNTSEESTPSVGWSFNCFKYQEAIDAGYSDAEIVAHLQKKFTDFDLQIHKKAASSERTKTLCWDLFGNLSYSVLIATCLYLLVFILSFCSRWIYKGFKQDSRSIDNSAKIKPSSE